MGLNKATWISVLLVLIGGICIGMAIPEQLTEQSENPTSIVLTKPRPQDVPSPGDWVKEEQIKVYKDRIVIDLADAQWAKFTDTNSMDPVIDAGSNAIHIVPKHAEQIHVGDIISYKPLGMDKIVIHRVIVVGEDENGVFYKVKGDNNPSVDPGKVRFHQVQRVLVGIIY